MAHSRSFEPFGFDCLYELGLYVGCIYILFDEEDVIQGRFHCSFLQDVYAFFPLSTNLLTYYYLNTYCFFVVGRVCYLTARVINFVEPRLFRSTQTV